MRALILGSDCPLGQALIEFLEALGRHELVAITASAARWKNERQTKKAVRRSACDLVVDMRVEAEADGGEKVHELDVKRCQWVAKACQRDKAGYLFVSSSRVFSGELDRPYKEDDQPDSEEHIGRSLAEAEALVRQHCEHNLILRLGPVFSSAGPNLVTQMLGSMMRGERQILDNNLRGCPVASSDGARVISALMDQLSTGDTLWGIYHYSSSETATHYEFAEAILAAASQFSEFGPSAVEFESPSADTPRLNRSLECSRIRNTFAIKQLPWRNAIADLVTDFYQQQT